MKRSSTRFALIFALIALSQMIALSAALAQTDLMDINAATAEDLALLPKIGEKTAGLIIQYRTVKGPFKSMRDLAKVPGLGKVRLEILELYTTVQGIAPAQPQQ